MAEWKDSYDDDPDPREDGLTRWLKRAYRWLFPEPGDQKGPGLFHRPKDFLCDSCKYNHPNTCTQPDRHNALKCGEYRKKGR